MRARRKRTRALGLPVLLFCLGTAAGGSADTQGGSLAAEASSARYYQVTCSDDGSGPPLSLVTQVRDLAPVAAPLLSVQIQKGNLATNGTDAVDADAGFSPPVWVNGGAGVYDVFVDKTASGAELFTLSFQCMTGADGSGMPAGTSISPSVPSVPALPALAALALVVGLIGGAGAAHRPRWPEPRP